ncbi:MAG: AraC family transcriptional regulator [Hungatella sp.]|nr:AraC family transcriptional regulator [Hungatella sp.]
MNIKKELAFQEFVRRENNLIRAPYTPEQEFYSVIKSGNTTKVRELCQESLLSKNGLGILSFHHLQNIKYHFVITAALVARYCMEGGMELSTAFSLSDFYIQKADSCTKPEEVAALHPIMCLDYAKRMKFIRKNKATSRHIAACIDYICDNLHTRITIETLASAIGLNSSYLSRLFKKEVGMTVSQYIRDKKIETASNMLIYSDYSPSQISSILAFPNQSYFTEIFHKKTGMTPLKYRNLNFRNTEIGIED